MKTKKLIFQATTAIAAIASCLLSTKAEAATIVLDFEGLQDLEPVEDFYDGGFGGDGSGPGPDLDITFSPNALAIVDQDAGGSGNFGNEPSPDTILFFLTGRAATLNVSSGFDTGFSFFYSAITQPGFVDVYSGLNATGTQLATINLPLTPFNGDPDPTGQFSPLVPIGVNFDGIARSIDFGGTINQIGFDNVTFGSATPGGGDNGNGGNGGNQPVPEPTSLFGLLVIGLGTVSKLKQKHEEA